MRFQELRDDDGAILAQGLHPAIAVVAANPIARAVLTSFARGQAGCIVLGAHDVAEEIHRAEDQARKDREKALLEKRAKVDEAENALRVAARNAEEAERAASAAGNNLSRFDDLAAALASAQESYEAAVRADAEAARSLAAALAELDRALGQRHIASTSLEQARKARENGSVPDAILQQALNLQSALAKAGSDRQAAVEQADDTSRSARSATREAMATLESAHRSLLAGVATIGVAPPAWGPGVPLPGLVGSYRDQLAAAVTSTHQAEALAKQNESDARAHLAQERRDLEDLTSARATLLDPYQTVVDWARSGHFEKDAAVFADDAFTTFGNQAATSLIAALSATGCQVIYLTEDPEVLGWAIALPHEAGGASTISSSKSRALASVSD